MIASSRPRTGFFGGEEPEWIVVALTLLALALGGVLMAAVTMRTSAATLDSLTLRYPTDWGQPEMGETAWEVAELGSATRLSATVLRELNPAAPVSLEELVAQRGFDQAGAHGMYRVLSTERTEVGGKSAVALRYAYVQDGLGMGSAALPVVMEGVDYIVPHQTRVYLLSLETEAQALEKERPTWDRVLRSVRFN